MGSIHSGIRIFLWWHIHTAVPKLYVRNEDSARKLTKSSFIFQWKSYKTHSAENLMKILEVIGTLFLKQELSENFKGFMKAFFLSSSCSKTHYYRKPLEYPVGKPTLSNPHHLRNGFLTWITWHLKQLQKLWNFSYWKEKLNQFI